MLKAMTKIRETLTICLLLVSTLLYGQSPLPTDGPLTIDPAMQHLGERLLEGKQGSIVAIDPRTGEVKCLVGASFEVDTVNRAIANEYSPGSTFKTAQALTLLSEGIINKETHFSCDKGFWKDDIHIGCHAHRSPLSLVQAIGQSCNSYFCKAFMAMIDNRDRYKTKLEAIDTWAEYMHSMGLGMPLGIDMEDEAAGLVPDAAYLEKAYNGRWNGTTIMWVGMGQGEIHVTPLQLCNLAASIANRGYFYTPHIHQATDDHPLDPKYTTKHLCKPAPKAYDTVVEGMRAAVKSGTAASINTADYQICGKTGTAENSGEDHSIFIGFAPMDNPQIAVAAFVENGGFGADLAAPVAALMIEQALNGRLSKHSEHKVTQWQQYYVVPDLDTPQATDDPTEDGTSTDTEPNDTPAKTESQPASSRS